MMLSYARGVGDLVGDTSQLLEVNNIVEYFDASSTFLPFA